MNREQVVSLLDHNNIRRTKTRILLLEVIANSDTPLEARQIYEAALAKAGDNSLWLSTVYRNLELFLKEGLVSEITPPDSDAIFYRLEAHGHNHYAICERCHMEIPLDLCPIEEVEDQLAQVGFAPTSHRLEVYGICKNCQKISQKTSQKA